MTKLLIITGGSRGIGKAAVELYIANGWRVINISRSKCDILDVQNIQIDLSKPDWPDKFQSELSRAASQAKQISLVHNASVFNRDDINTLQADSLREVLEFNLVSTQTLNTIFLPHMQPGSSIIYVGSTLSEIGVPGRASYVISKHALVGMMRATCQDLAGKHITTCCVCPGFVNTTMVTDQIDNESLDTLIKAKVSAGRMIEPQEIAELIYFCATHPVVNGSVLHANLGQIAN